MREGSLIFGVQLLWGALWFSLGWLARWLWEAGHIR